MEQYKSALIEKAQELIIAVEANNFEDMAKAGQFIHFALDTLSRINAFDNFIKQNAYVEEEEK